MRHFIYSSLTIVFTDIVAIKSLIFCKYMGDSLVTEAFPGMVRVKP